MTGVQTCALPISSVQAFLASAEGHALSMAFLKIDDVPTRRRIVDLVSTIAKDTP